MSSPAGNPSGESAPGGRPALRVGYCTNVHAGATLELTRRNLEEHAVAVRRFAGLTEPLGVGLWLAAPAARELAADPAAVASFRDWLAERGLRVFTLNGFPYGDFHEAVVKRKVYRPDWRDDARVRYTLDLVAVLAGLLAPGEDGSISTLPVAWAGDVRTSDDARAAAANLLLVADQLADLESRTGALIHLDLEPEPGCLLERSDDAVRFFEDHLLHASEPERVHRHLRLCHDICHAAVMFEDQAAMLDRYARAGIRIGKVQVSSAVRAEFSSLDHAERLAALEELRGFREDRYLHQTVVARPGAAPVFYEDLPAALTDAERAGGPDGEWRTHFHVPIYAERLGRLTTTQDQIDRWLALTAGHGVAADVRHYEIETYAWGVLPPRLRREPLAAGIAEELAWFRSRLAAAGLS